MKGSCTLVASVLAASTVAFTSSSCDRDFAFYLCSSEASSSSSSSTYSTSRKGEVEVSRAHRSMSDKEKFAPRFDGLRFIETLVTAHR